MNASGLSLIPSTYLVMRECRWGKGDSIHEASKQCRGTGKTLVFLTNDPDIYVDDMGGVSYRADSITIRIGLFRGLSPIKPA